jgi:23S rRNA (cytosine1962-C5)-methyltransferase
VAAFKTARITLKTARNSRHPWIFTKMVFHPRRRPLPGSIVEVFDRGGRFAGRGIYHPDRTIAVRILTEDPEEPLDEVFFRARLEAAKRLREEILRIPEKSDAYRLVHSEGDGFSGLIIDKYADLLVIEPYSAGYLVLGSLIADALKQLYPGCRVAFRPDARTEASEGVSFAALASQYPPPKSVDIVENGMKMRVDLAAGHKTGFFLDQRENRALLASMARRKEVLDLFCYTGGFGIMAMLAGAAKAIGVDLDEKALETAAVNARLNSVEMDFHHEDAFDYLRCMLKEGRKTDVVVVDPAKLAGVKAEIPRALKTYNDINALAMRALKPGGLLLTCSCSGLISEQQFLSVLHNAAGEAGVELQIFKITGAAPDHPVRTDFPEGRYLTAVFARVV